MNKINNKITVISNKFMRKILKETYDKTITETKFINKENNYSLNLFRQPINPLLWEFGHLTNFYDVHLLKYIKQNYKPIFKNNKIFDSHLTSLPKRFEDKSYNINEVLIKYTDTYLFLDDYLKSNQLNNKISYLFLLNILHNHMHIESILYSKKSLLLNKPYRHKKNIRNSELNFIKINGGLYEQGTDEGEYLISFDNEKPKFSTKINSFYMADIPVTNKIYLRFIKEFGYYNRSYWCEDGWEFIKNNKIKAPLYWEEIDYKWYINLTEEIYDYKLINLNEPVCHISWYEAKAVAKWLGGRLPTEAEWEYVATNNGTTKFPWGNEIQSNYANVNYKNLCTVEKYYAGYTKHGIKQMIGNVWEWCEDTIYPYDGFSIDPIYREFSYPYFGFKKNLRGGSWAVPYYLINPKYRNAQLPETRIQFTGVRIVKDII